MVIGATITLLTRPLSQSATKQIVSRESDWTDGVLTYLPSSDISIARMLSVCPTSFPVRLPERGSQVRITLSGPPVASRCPYGSVAIAYTEHFGPGASGGARVMRGCVLAVLFSVDRVRVMSHSLTVRSKDPEATQLRSVLQI